MHSIGHEVCYLGVTGMPIIDPSTFHGYTDSLQQYLDGVKSLRHEKVGDEDCDKIEVSIMKHQRSWYLWLSKRDHLPRKLKEIVRVSYDIIITEDWSSVTVNADMPDTLFAWKPPEGWTQWKKPPIEIGLLKPGTKAPDFELASADGKQIKLSDYRGQIVWFYVGGPADRPAARRCVISKNHTKYKDKGLVVLGFDCRTTSKSPWKCCARTVQRSPISSTLPKPRKKSVFRITRPRAHRPCR